MQQQANYQKSSMLLKGQGMGILILEQRQVLHYEFHCSSLPPAPRLVLFSDERHFTLLPELCGDTSELHIGAIRAAALLRKGKPFMRTQSRNFDWSLALSALARQSAPARSAKNKPATPAVSGSAPPSSPKADEKLPCQSMARSSLGNPFPGLIKNAVWKRVEYPYFANGSHYLIGEVIEDQSMAATILAVPGEYAINPPPWLKGFDYFAHSAETAQGYWLFAKDDRTGKAISIQSIAHRKAQG